MRERTEAQWRTYLGKLPNSGLDALAREWGMNTISHVNGDYVNKQERISLLIVHLDVTGKIK